MQKSHIFSEGVEEPVFIFHAVVAASVIVWPFLVMLMGFNFGSIIPAGAVYTADRYWFASRKRKAEEIRAAPVAYQRYVARCAKRFFWVRMIPVAGIAYFLKQPVGLIYLFFCGIASIAEVMWESSKLADLESKEPIQPLEPMPLKRHGSA